MFKKFSKILFVILLISFGIFLLKPKSKDLNIPIIVWVWERSENLYFLKDKNVSFAYLAGTVTKTNNELVFYPRRQPLRIPDNRQTISVVRIEDKSDNHELSDKDLVDVSEFIVKSCIEKKSNISCQIDFDATESQTDFYKKLVVNVKNKLPKEMKLSLTALVSWCTNGESWFKDLPIDEAVPMFFRLGKDENVYWQKIEKGELKLNQICQKSIGIATDEPLPNKTYLQNKPIYIFNSDYWSTANWDIMKSTLQKINE
jgi:hypothetical protein